MKTERVLRAIAIVTSIVLAITLLALAVSALDGWIGIVALVGVIVLCLLGLAYLRKHVRRGTVLEIDLESGVVEEVGSDPISQVMHRGAVTVRDFVDALGRAADDDRITGLVVRLGNTGMGIAHAQELRDAVHSFRKSGKPTIAFADVFGESKSATVDFFLASSFDDIYLQPRGLASVDGMVANGRFLKGLFDKLDLTPDFDHRKEYKAAKYLFTETEFTPPHREAVDDVVGDQFSQVVTGIATDRGLDSVTVESMIDSAPLTADEALAAGLVDHLGHREQAYEGAGDQFMLHDRYLKKVGRPHRKGNKIALIYGTGSIARGSSRFDPLSGGSSLGADEVAKAFRQAIDDKKVKTIVFRVDSPGGSAVASEVVGHEVERARKADKPVVVSMANVAGSGGYWISAPANKIVAQPGTITGSIGVVFGKLANREAWARIGVTFDQILHGQNATFTSSRDVYTESERERRDVLIDDIYTSFVGYVASGRELSIEQTEEIAKGRIWTGSQGLENGLVDALGGLETAIDLAKEEARIAADDKVHLVVFPPKRAIPLPERRESSEPVETAVALVADLFTGLRESTSGVQARIPWFGGR